jgi:hypothetical protein
VAEEVAVPLALPNLTVELVPQVFKVVVRDKDTPFLRSTRWVNVMNVG